MVSLFHFVQAPALADPRAARGRSFVADETSRISLSLFYPRQNNSEQVCRFHFCCFHSGQLGCAPNPEKVCWVYQPCKKLLGTDGSQLDLLINRYANEAPGAAGAGRLPTFADGGEPGDYAVPPPVGDEEPEFQPMEVILPAADEAVEDGPVSDEVMGDEAAEEETAAAEPTEEEAVGLSSYAAAALFEQGGCVDDPRFSFDNGPEGIKTCETYVSEVGRDAVLRNRCNKEHTDGKLLKDHCRKSCGNCSGEEGAAAVEEEPAAAAVETAVEQPAETASDEAYSPSTAEEETDEEEEAADLEEAVLTIPPPPIRCIPEGDDEVFSEVYQDDLTDDRYDRCKRWEKKHGMTVAAYWDGHGIDSELELNVMETMVTMDAKEDEQSAAAEAEEAAAPEEAAPAPVVPEPAAAEPAPAPLSEPNTAGCVDDPSFSFVDGEKGDKTCDTYVAGVGRPAVLKNRCDHDLGSGKSLKDYCPLSCGVCEAGDEVPAGTRAAVAEVEVENEGPALG